MPKIYSQELRQKLIDEYFTSDISIRNLAKKHGVGKTWAWRLLKAEKRNRLIAEKKANRHLHIVKMPRNIEEQ
jgi:transposase-like protein